MEASSEAQPKEIVPIDISIEDSTRCVVITGPNTGAHAPLRTAPPAHSVHGTAPMLSLGCRREDSGAEGAGAERAARAEWLWGACARAREAAGVLRSARRHR